MHIQDGRTSLFMASQNGHQDVVQLLIKHDADVNHAMEVCMCVCMFSFLCGWCVWLACVISVCCVSFVCVCVCLCKVHVCRYL